MNKIVRDNYPAGRLPEDLREGLDPEVRVRVVVETTDVAPRSRRSLRELRDRAARSGPIDGDPVGRIRTLRDEWDAGG